MARRRKVALVTGSGSRRVGNAVAKRLGEQGYSLAIHYRSSAAQAGRTVRSLEAKGTEAISVQADVAREEDVERMVEEVYGRFGRVDVLVNCAAVWRPVKLEEVDAGEVRYNFEANTLGTFLCCQKVGLRMVEQKTGGCIVNVGDWAILRPYLDYSAYFTSKGAIPTLTSTFAHELAARNTRVRVNCVMPGPVMLPEGMPKREKRRSINATLVKREGTPGHVAHAVVFCVENDFVTGACIPVDGGRSVYAPEDPATS